MDLEMQVARELARILFLARWEVEHEVSYGIDYDTALALDQTAQRHRDSG